MISSNPEFFLAILLSQVALTQMKTEAMSLKFLLKEDNHKPATYIPQSATLRHTHQMMARLPHPPSVLKLVHQLHFSQVEASLESEEERRILMQVFVPCCFGLVTTMLLSLSRRMHFLML